MRKAKQKKTREIERNANASGFRFHASPAFSRVCFALTLRGVGGVKVCGDAIFRYFWCGFAEFFYFNLGYCGFILTKRSVLSFKM